MKVQGSETLNRRNDGVLLAELLSSLALYLIIIIIIIIEFLTTVVCLFRAETQDKSFPQLKTIKMTEQLKNL